MEHLLEKLNILLSRACRIYHDANEAETLEQAINSVKTLDSLLNLKRKKPGTDWNDGFNAAHDEIFILKEMMDNE